MIYATLTPKSSSGGMSIDELIEYLEDYSENLEKKMKTLVSRLMDIGIDMAMASSGEYAGMIRFTKQINGENNLLIATDGQKITRVWKYKGGIKTATVSPLLMAEFGSGWLAEVLDDVEGVGQGTFPGQKHAFNPDGWRWTTLDGIHHHSYGEEPTHPMHNAMLVMMADIDRVAKEVFA